MPAMAPLIEGTTVGATAFGLVFLAEMGDKSQLVCMTLAARHRHWPVLAGSLVAFALLNTLAVAVGAGLAQWLPQRALAAIVALLFGIFGVLALRTHPEEDGVVRERGRYGIFLTTLLMLVVAEMGDKTQLAVASMAGISPPVPVWLGATFALAATSVIGVFVGCRLLQRVPVARLHQGSGVFFLLLAGLTLTRVF
jgi:Ca2+/H+ antiporter, TMEM165/GDT1 family